ncbi:hypothetical protein S83_047557, partial [Arachis hypogaea]
SPFLLLSFSRFCSSCCSPFSVAVLLASLCRGSARLSLSWFCSPLPARLIPSTVAFPGSPIPALAVTPAVTCSAPRNSPVTRSRTPKPSPVVLLGTHLSPVVLRGSCSRYRPPRYNAINSRIPLHPSPSSLKLCIYFSYLQTTALMLVFSEHLRDNYSLATDNSSFEEKVVPFGSRAVHCCDNSFFLKQNHISRGIIFSREVKMLWDLNWVKDGLMWKTTPITLIFLAAMMPCLDPLGVLSFGWNFGNIPVIFGSAILGFLLQWFGALALGYCKVHHGHNQDSERGSQNRCMGKPTEGKRR